MNISRIPSIFVTSLAAVALAAGWVVLANPARADDGRARGSVSIRGGATVIGTAHGRGRSHARVFIAPSLLLAPFVFDYRYPYTGYPYAYPYGYPYAFPYGYPSGYPYPYPYPGGAPDPAQPPAYVERAPAPDAEPAPPVAQTPPAGYWYWCSDPRGYYPTVRECPQGWLQVAPQPPEQPRQPR